VLGAAIDLLIQQPKNVRIETGLLWEGGRSGWRRWSEHATVGTTIGTSF
jgi:hypothetical protein